MVRESFISRIAFPAFAWGLAFHSLIMAALFGLFGLPEGLVRVLAAWKEMVLALLLVVIILRALSGHGNGIVVTWADLWIGGLVAIALCYLLAENLWLRANLPRQAELLGIRDAVFFMLTYFLGRATPGLVSDDSGTRRLFTLVLFTCILGVIERIFVTPEMLVALGVAAYFQEFLGVAAFTAGNDYGLPMNYWTTIGGQPFRRSGSVYLSGQAFAVPFLLFFPLATAWVFARAKRTNWQLVAYGVICTALLLTLTRMTIMIAFIQLTLFVAMLRRPEWAVGGLALGGSVFAAAMLLIPGFPTFVWHTLSWQEGSSVSHMNDWIQGAVVFAERPWGSGLGTTDQTAIRAGILPLTADNMYLKYGVEMGVIGLALLVLTLVAIGSTSLKLFREGNESQRRMGITLWLATIGIAINGITAVVFNSIALGWIFFWLVGSAVSSAHAPAGRRAASLRLDEPAPA